MKKIQYTEVIDSSKMCNNVICCFERKRDAEKYAEYLNKTTKKYVYNTKTVKVNLYESFCEKYIEEGISLKDKERSL